MGVDSVGEEFVYPEEIVYPARSRRGQWAAIIALRVASDGNARID